MTASPDRLCIAILFGGRSAEHDVSVMSATNVMQALAPDKYDPLPVFVTKEGRWLMSRFEGGRLDTPSAGTELCLVPGGRGRMVALPTGGAPQEAEPIDILFPVLHGLFGEDGTVQGLAEVARVPLVGCDVLGSAVALDKDLTKRLLREAGIAVARSLTIRQGEAPPFTEVTEALGLPIFVKPARQGSSVGVSKVTSEAAYQAALVEGFRFDRKLLAEEFVAGREVECAVLEDEEGGLFVSRPGEIVPAADHGFYSYDAKYVDADGAALIVPAQLPRELENRMREMAAEAFRATACDGMARVDFFVTADGGLLLNELNTIPGFTDISMYSKAMAASGVGYGQVIDRLVAHGLARAKRSA